MIRRVLALVVLMTGLLLGASCATSGGDALSDLQPGERPAIETDEAGLWRLMDDVETELKTSGRVVQDPSLNAYVRGVLCRVAPAHCADIRLYIVRTPYFNASMAPNGMMQVWTGLLLRTQNEAQLGYVLGHEMGHYLRRHTLSRWRDARAKTDAATFVKVLTSAAGVDYAGSLTDLAVIASLSAYSRNQEREADRIGFELTVKAGYDPRVAPKLWETLIAEQEASDRPEPSIFVASHPATHERIATLKRMASEASEHWPRTQTGRQDYLSAVLPLRSRLLREELRKREFETSQVVLDRLLQEGMRPGEIHFFQGELHRLRDEKEDPQQALAAYDRALAYDGAPAETYKSRGMVYMRTGQNVKARRAFREYLMARPGAPDRLMIESYMGRLR